MPYPFQPNLGSRADEDDVPDWAVGDYPIFERAINSGASAGIQRMAESQSGETVKGRAVGKLLPQFDNWNRWVVEQHLASPDKVNGFNARALKYFGPRPSTWRAIGSIGSNKPGTITRQQDALARKFFDEYKDHPDNAGQFKEYTDAIASGRLRIVP